MSSHDASLGAVVSEHSVRMFALVEKIFSIVLTGIAATFALLAFANADAAVVGVPNIVYLGVGLVFVAALVFQVYVLFNLMGSRIILYQNGIQKIQRGQAKTYSYSQFSSILPSATVYRLAMLIPIPLYKRYYYALLGSSRATTLTIKSDYKDMERMGNTLLSVLPRFTY